MADYPDIVGVIEQRMLEGRVRSRARHHEMAGKPYRPSSGTEGACFQNDWCGYCARDAEFQADPDFGEGCPIVADTFAYQITDPRYPKEWVYDRDGRPCCTAFTTDPNKPLRCDKTIDMFGPEIASHSSRSD